MTYIAAVDHRVTRLRHAWTATGSRQLVTAIARSSVARMEGTIVDIGGGRDAAHHDAWADGAVRVRLDISMQHHPDVQADAAALPFSNGTLDGAVMIETLEHIASPWLAVDEIQRVLKPGGIFFGTVAFIFPVHGDPHDFYRYGADGLRHLLRRFAEVSIEPYGNTYGAAWNLLALHSRSWRVLNPLMRRAGRTADPRCPQGYAFTARR
jgi:SAM-dependent methyltransferase